MGGLDGLGYLPASSSEGGGVVGCVCCFPGSSANGEIVVGLAFTGARGQFLFLLSIFKILEKISLSPLDFQDFLKQHFDN